MRFSKKTRQTMVLLIGTVLLGTSSLVFAGLLDVVKPPKPGEMPDAPQLPELPDLPELPSFEGKMPTPGQSAAPQVSCLQQGKMDMTRPSLPLLSCWESAVASGEALEELQKACTVQMTPMADVKSILVPKCPTKALGTCIGAKSGKSSKSDLYHYTPQTPPEWIKARKNCEKAGGEWYGLGNPRSWF